jgi:hypothetical protein
VGLALGGSILSGVFGSNTASKSAKAQTKASQAASNAQVEAAKIASDTQWKMYQQTRKDQLPWLTAGAEALGDLSDMVQAGPGKFENSPYYQLGLEDQNKATNAFLASRGQYASGGAAKALQANAVNNMNQNRGNWLNEWIYAKLNPTQALSGVGRTTAANLGGVATNAGNAIANNQLYSGNAVAQNQINSGNARATGIINQNNAITGAINSGANALAAYYANKNKWDEV